MIYLLYDNEAKYALVSDTSAADGWYTNICEIDTTLPYRYNTLNSNTTMLETFKRLGHTIIATFSNISEFHSLYQTHPELFI